MKGILSVQLVQLLDNAFIVNKTWEAAPILRYLGEHLTQPAFTCRLRWEPDMLVLWDNRLCVHQAYNDYQGHRRELYRTTVIGETPV